MEGETYNGWKNYPTWAVNLWLGNDQGLAYDVNELVSQPVDLLGSESSLVYVEEDRRQRIAAADRIRDFVHDLVENDGANLASDLLGYAMDQVDWFEIADAWLEDAETVQS